MSIHINVIQGNVKEVNIPSNFINKLYKSVLKHKQTEDYFDDTTNMVGRIDTAKTYREYVTAINEVFPLLEINPEDYYVYFEDPEVMRILNAKIGDGMGVTESAILNVVTWDSRWIRENNQPNNNIVKFNEFYRFSNVKSLPGSAFLLCENLQEININNIITLNNSVFDRCHSLKKVEANNVTTVETAVFNDCTLLSDINMPKVETIGQAAFANCPLTNADFGHSITNIGHRAFIGSAITDIDLSNTTIIGDNVFNGCTSLANIHTDLSNVISIGGRAFYDCQSLTGTIKLNVSTVFNMTFYRCKGITSIDLSNVNAIEMYAWGGTFQDCTNLQTVILNPNIKSLCPRAFQGCTKLVNIDTSNIESYYNSENTAGSQFYGCSLLRQITINENVTVIPGNFANGCSSLTEITIPASVTHIYGDSFKSCSSLTKVTILATTPPEGQLINSFNYPNTYPIYVPAESVEAYKAAENWQQYKNRIQAIPT